MEQNEEQIRDLNLKAFDLGQAGGGMQLIIADKQVNENEHYVFTVGKGMPQLEAQNEMPNQEANGLKKAFMSFRDNILKKKPNESQNEEKNNIKLRCFKLTWDKDKQMRAEEYMTWEGIAEVAKMFGFDKEKE